MHKSKWARRFDFEDPSFQEKLDFVMKPSLQMTKDLVKVVALIDSDPSNYFM